MTFLLFLAALVVFALVMAGMAVGVILGRRRITGSCGGLANLQAAEGEPMCECGARPGDACGAGREGRFNPAAAPAGGRLQEARERATV